MWIIVEEYEPNHIEETLTNVLPYHYESYQEALDALHAIGDDLMVEHDGSNRMAVPPERGIYRDTYYIMELARG